MAVSKQRFKDLAKRFVDDTFVQFNKNFTIESKLNVSDGQGGFTVEWSTFQSITGFVKIATASEGNLDDHIKSNYMKKFSFEYIAGITNDMRILYEGDYYNIQSIDPVQDVDVWIDIIANKDVAT